MNHKCNCCGEIKSIFEYNRDRHTKTGYMYSCRECMNKKKRDFTDINPSHGSERSKKYRLKNALKIHKYNSIYRSINKEKIKAYNRVHYCLSHGYLKKKPCVKCGDKQSKAHHEDYTKPLDIIWLCEKHHRRLHEDK